MYTYAYICRTDQPEGNKSYRRGLAGDRGVAVRLAGVPVDDEELPAGRVGVLGGEAARQHGAGLHVKDELGALAAVLVGEEAGEVGVGGARDPHVVGVEPPGVEPERAAPVRVRGAGNRRTGGGGQMLEIT